MDPLIVISSALGLSCYAPLCYQIWTGKITQNMATFILWGLLDGIAAGSIFLEGGNFWLPMFYSLGCVFVIASILKSGSMKWTWLETFISILVAICIIVWLLVGNTWATIVSTLAVVIASVPMIVDLWLKPADSAPFTYSAFVLANFLAFLAGKDWSIAERFYPGVCTILTLSFVVLAFRKFRKPAIA